MTWTSWREKGAPGETDPSPGDATTWRRDANLGLLGLRPPLPPSLEFIKPPLLAHAHSCWCISLVSCLRRHEPWVLVRVFKAPMAPVSTV